MDVITKGEVCWGSCRVKVSHSRSTLGLSREQHWSTAWRFIFKDLFYTIRLKYQTRGAQTVKHCGRVEDMAENSLLIGPRK